tara:strand:+ start:19291 stop:20463 length:1173 start_codon:yes stop_codon:yes gene_type:complete
MKANLNKLFNDVERRLTFFIRKFSNAFSLGKNASQRNWNKNSMNSIKYKSQFIARDFAVRVRQVLKRIGQSDVRFEPNWLDLAFDNHQVVFNVPISVQSSVPIIVLEYSYDEESDEKRDIEIDNFAHALVILSKARKHLCKFQRQLIRSAIAKIEEARGNGLDLQLEKMAFCPFSASEISTYSWKELVEDVTADMHVRHIDYTLRSCVSSFEVKDDDEIGQELAELCEQHVELQKVAAEFEAMNADLVLDTITLDIMEAERLDKVSILRELLVSESGSITIRKDEDSALAISMDRGHVSIFLTTSNFVWNGKEMWFTDKKGVGMMISRNIDFSDLAVGKTLASHVDHPAFKSRPISGNGRAGHLIDFELDRANVFDAYAGTIRIQNNLAA